MTADEILKAIPTLKQEDLRRIYVRVGALLTEEHGADGDEYYCFKTFTEMLSMTGIRNMPWRQVKVSSFYKTSKFRAGVVLLVDFVEQHWPDVRPAARMWYLRLCIFVCIQWMIKNKWQLPLSTFKAAGVAFREIQACMSDQFPNYVESGLLDFVSKRVGVPLEIDKKQIVKYNEQQDAKKRKVK